MILYAAPDGKLSQVLTEDRITPYTSALHQWWQCCHPPPSTGRGHHCVKELFWERRKRSEAATGLGLVRASTGAERSVLSYPIISVFQNANTGWRYTVMDPHCSRVSA